MAREDEVIPSNIGEGWAQWFKDIDRKRGQDKRELVDLLVRVSEYLDNRADIRDGEDGPKPNEAMSLGQDVDAFLERLKAMK
jgi:hypothetical protein